MNRERYTSNFDYYIYLTISISKTFNFLNLFTKTFSLDFRKNYNKKNAILFTRLRFPRKNSDNY
ncbi:MAG: hypothetical protein K0S23_1579 [Fluviicola sp.]|jgi:hypothetical protein|nr:hypothetical protein [Fluviicola sp.]